MRYNPKHVHVQVQKQGIQYLYTTKYIMLYRVVHFNGRLFCIFKYDSDRFTLVPCIVYIIFNMYDVYSVKIQKLYLNELVLT